MRYQKKLSCHTARHTFATTVTLGNGSFTWINIRGSKGGVSVVITATVAKIVPLLLVVVLGMSHISEVNLKWTSSFTFGNIGAATLILFYAFLGIENAVANSGEFKNPSRVVPLGILSGLSFVLLLYISIQLVTQGMLGSQLSLYKDAPLAEVSKRLFAYAGIVLITVGAAVSMLGSLSGAILAIPRVLFAGAKDGIFPKLLGAVHYRYITPHKAIILYAVIDYLFAVFGAFKQLVILSTASVLLIYLGVVLSVIKLRHKGPQHTEKTFTIPAGLTVPVLAIITIIWLLYSLTNAEIIGMSIALAAFSVIYLVMKLYKNKQKQLF